MDLLCRIFGAAVPRLETKDSNGTDSEDAAPRLSTHVRRPSIAPDALEYTKKTKLSPLLPGSGPQLSRKTLVSSTASPARLTAAAAAATAAAGKGLYDGGIH